MKTFAVHAVRPSSSENSCHWSTTKGKSKTVKKVEKGLGLLGGIRLVRKHDKSLHQGELGKFTTILGEIRWT